MPSSNPKRLARIAGVFYLFVAIFGGFAEGFVDPKIYVAGDALATASNVVANSSLVRIGVAAHLINAVFFILVGLTLYVLLQHVNKNVARTMLVFVGFACAISTLNAVFQFEGLQIATNPYYETTFGIAGSNGLVLLLLDIQHFGTLSGQVFFGLWLAPMGYLAYKSGMFPRLLAIALIVATVSYLIDVFTAFLVPDLAARIHSFLTIAPLISEVWLLLYLLVKGVNDSAQNIPTATVKAVNAAPVLP